MAFIEKRGKDHWKVRWRGPDGKERSKTFTGKGSKHRADDHLTSVKSSQLEGTYIDPRLGRVLFEEWSTRWMETTVNLKPQTRAGYESLLKNHLLPAFGKVALARLEPMEIQRWVARSLSRV